MKRFIVAILSGLLLFSNTVLGYAQKSQHKRPVVAVVLSGGGAKGAAHVGALKVIEEAGIPIDIVVGTSMGAIVGGLYSVGYTPQSMDSIFRVQDWNVLLSDSKYIHEESFLARERQDNYIINIPIKIPKKDSTAISSPGLVEGKNILRLLRKLIKPYSGEIDFDSLENRFACVAVDLAAGTEYVFRCGSLDSAIRSSMSIPGVFKPIKKDSMLLVDGGLLNNYPVDVARQMGADIIIGVDLGDGLVKIDKIKTLMDVVNQITGISEFPKRQANRADTDLYIKVNVSGYTAASFTKTAIDTLISRGETAAMEKFDSLKVLGELLGGNEEYLKERNRHFLKLRDDVDLYKGYEEYVFEPFPTDALGFSANFNQEEKASLIVQTYVRVPFVKLPSQIGATIRLGKRYKFKMDWASMIAKGFYVDFNYEVGYNDIELANEGSSLISTTFSNNFLSLGIYKSWRYAKIEGGVKYNNYNFKDALINVEDDYTQFANKMSSGSVNFGLVYVNFGVNTTDRKIFATKGMSLDTEAELYKGKKIAGDNGNTVYGFKGFGTLYLSTSPRFCFIPSAYVRYLHKKSYVYGIFNTYGGEWEGYYMPTHMPFYGMQSPEAADRTIAILSMKGRLRIGNKHYVYAILNAGADGDGFNEAFKFSPLKLGGGLKYSYDSVVGPLSLTLSGSNVTDKLNLFVSIGYIF